MFERFLSAFRRRPASATELALLSEQMDLTIRGLHAVARHLLGLTHMTELSDAVAILTTKIALLKDVNGKIATNVEGVGALATSNAGALNDAASALSAVKDAIAAVDGEVIALTAIEVALEKALAAPAPNASAQGSEVQTTTAATSNG